MRWSLSLLLAGFVACVCQSAPPAPIPAVTFSPDGKLLAAASGRQVLLFDTKTGQPRPGRIELPGRVTALAMAPDGRLAIASGQPGQSGLLSICLPTQLKEPQIKLESIQAHKDSLYALAFSPDGKLLATGSYDRTIKLWDVAPGSQPKLRHTLTDHSDSVYAVAFHPTLPLLASGAADRAVKVWDTATGNRLYTLGDPTDWVYSVAWSPDGKRLFAGGVDRSIRVWQANATGGQLQQAIFAHNKPILQLLPSTDGKLLFSVAEDRLIKAWDSATLVERKVFESRRSDILGLALNPATTLLARSQFNGTLELLDATTGKMRNRLLPALPVLQQATPSALSRAAKTIITIQGTGLSQTTGVKLSQTDIQAKLVNKTEDGGSLQVELTASPDTALGEFKLSVLADGLESAPIPLRLDRFPIVEEQGATDSAATGMRVSLPVSIAGQLDRGGDVDYFRFDATMGQELGVELQVTDQKSKQFDPVLTLTDNSGQVLSEVVGTQLGFTFAKAGRYALAVRDRDYRGGPTHSYRLSLGPIPVVTSLFPLAISRGQSSMVQLRGVNLPAALKLPVTMTAPADAKLGSRLPVPILRLGGDPIGKAEVTVLDGPSQSMPPSLKTELPPNWGSVNGVLARPGERHLVQFSAKAGEELILETHAARLGSPLDTLLEVLDATGQPVPRALLRAVARTSVTFRDHDSEKPGIRLDAWNELAIDDYLYVNGEVMRILALPRGPDDDCQFYRVGGRRVGFLDTTPIHHALGTTIFKVEIHPPATVLPPNGLPQIRLDYRNDDGGPGYAQDSRISFVAPVDGSYQVRIQDANGAGSQQHGYRLTVRRPDPGFTISYSPTTPAVWRGEGLPITVTASRTDGFEGPIRVRFADLPRGWSAPMVTIGEGQESTSTVLLAAKDAAPPTQPFKLIADATRPGQLTPLVREFLGGVPQLVEPGDLSTRVDLKEVVIRPGAEARIQVSIERRGDFKGRVPLDVRGLPHGVRVLNVGLNGILITPNVTQREVVLYAEPWVKPQEEPFVVLARSERKRSEHAAPPVLLRVVK